MKKSITIGIIVYNVEEFLPACLESAIRQKGDDIEIIVVDDGSTDASGKICDEYAARDSRIKVVHKENGGASTARNVIIDIAEGEWISFVDGDDMLDDNAVETMKQSLSNEYQIVFFDSVNINGKKRPTEYTISLPDMELTGDLLKRFALQTVCPCRDGYNFVNKTIIFPWGKAYNKQFLLDNELRYEPAARKGQDLIFSVYCMTYSTKVLLVRKAVYMYRVYGNSITNRYNPKITEYNNNLAQLLYEHITNKCAEYKDELLARYYERCIRYIKVSCDLYFCSSSNKKPYREREKEFLDYIDQPWCAEAIKNADVSEFTEDDVILHNCLAKRDFKTMCSIVRKKEIKTFIKTVLELPGLGILKKIIKI